MFGLALAAFGAFLVQFIVNLVNNGRRKKRSLDGTEEQEHILETVTRWALPVISGDYQSIWRDVDQADEGLLRVLYNSVPDRDSVTGVNEMLTQFAAMGETLREAHARNQVAFPDSGLVSKDEHRRLCEKYRRFGPLERANARISRYYWYSMTHFGLAAWADPYLKSIGHGLDHRNCEEWAEVDTRANMSINDDFAAPGADFESSRTSGDDHQQEATLSGSNEAADHELPNFPPKRNKPTLFFYILAEKYGSQIRDGHRFGDNRRDGDKCERSGIEKPDRALTWLSSLDEEYSLQCNAQMVARWDYIVNVTDETAATSTQANEVYATFKKDAWERVTAAFDANGQFPNWESYSDSVLVRKIRKLKDSAKDSILTGTDLTNYLTLQAEMETIYAAATICNLDGSECGLALEPRYPSGDAMWVSPYDEPYFQQQIAAVWEEMKPWYKKLHAYVRRRLVEHYGSDKVDPTGPIPAQLLGNHFFPLSLCLAAGEYDPNDPAKPLYKCDFYQNAEAGQLMENALKLGYSLPWTETMEAITGQREMSAASLQAYFKPLEEFMDNYLAETGDCIGWGDECLKTNN
ncbi:unnamed protein product [Notodromas monacha]|uniref:Angiotensin-converting enzyme n=1 Tax=Notodromas monacha TaxID=399045 RepID=A0A7R9GJV0_9CRUS|nr:unnamed protein product [Notodromas monacha]CAG0924055.1 unnamed protein product [Notodromas monacha]